MYNLSEYKYDYSFFNQSVSLKQKWYISSNLGDGVQLPRSPMPTPRHVVYDLHLDPVLVIDRSLPCGGAPLPGDQGSELSPSLMFSCFLS